MRFLFRHFALLGLLTLTTPALRAADSFGYTEPYRAVKMSFPETGVISELPVREGDKVKQGQVLARLDYQVLAKDLEIARKEFDLQSERFAKLKVLAKDNRVSPEELRRAETDLSVDQIKVERTQAQINNRTLISPFDGIVSEVKKEISESVDPANHVLMVVQLDKLTVNMYLTTKQAFGYRQGQSTTLYLADSKETVPATVEFVSPVTDAASSTVRVKFTIVNSNGTYKSGVRCDLAAPTPAKGDADKKPGDKKPAKEFIYQ